MAIAEPSSASSNGMPNSPERPVIFRSCTPAAPAKLVKALTSGDDQHAWRAWAKQLSKRKTPVGIEQLFSGRRSALTWNLPSPSTDADSAAELGDWIDARHALSNQRASSGEAIESDLRQWLAAVEPPRGNLDYAFQCLAWCHALPELAQLVSANLWWKLFAHLLGVARQSGNSYIETSPLECQLLDGELPLTLAYMFPELTACDDLQSAARKALSDGPTMLLDGEGLPQAGNLANFRPLVGCWTRCRVIGKFFEDGCWNAEADQQYLWAIRQTWRLMRADGSQALAGEAAGQWCKPLFQAIIDQLPNVELPFAKAGWPQGKPPAKLAQAKTLKPRKPSKDDDKPSKPAPQADATASKIDAATAETEAAETADPALPSVHSEWSEVAMLRPDWKPKTERLCVTYADQQVQLELCRDNGVLLAGQWSLNVRFDGQPLQPSGDWEEVCWVADQDVDYLEVEMNLGQSHSVQRQILFSRRDRFLLMADAILGTREGRLEYRASLPLGPQIQLVGNADTREGYLMADTARAIVMPLALPEWRIDPRFGKLESTDRRLELSQTTIGLNLFCPLWIDLAEKRLDEPCTWRQLTVAQGRAIELPDVAVGYRIQVGKKQWIVYRSLASRANRTLIGHNLATEFLCARFKQGEVESVLEIE